MSRKISYAKNADFYDYEENFEVLFLGTSHMIMGISPMELWNEYGITSYNMADYGQWLPVDYWVLKNALDYNRPKLVVVDIYAIGTNEKYCSRLMLQVHEAFDIMPLSQNKLSAINDLFGQERYMEFLFPFSFYHSRWNEISESFWDKAAPSTEKGANLDNSYTLSYASVNAVEEPEWIDSSDKNVSETTGKEYLRKIIELCQNNGIEVLLVALPYAPTEDEQKDLNSAQDIAVEYGIKYFNMNINNDYINYQTDMYDAGHLNSSGTRKTTKVLGQYLLDHYPITDLREDSISSYWNDDYIEYSSYKVQWLKKQTTLDSYLMLLSEDKYNVFIEINDKTIIEDEMYTNLLENLGVDTTLIKSGTNYIVVDCENKQFEILDDTKINGSMDSALIGDASFYADEIDENKEAALHITVISKLIGEVVDNVDWINNNELAR